MSDPRRVLEANERFAATFAHGELDRRPRRRLAVVTCMDARIDPLASLGLELGDANVLRNAGAAVTDDVLRSLAVAHALLGTEAALVVGHTECGLHGASDDALREALGAPPGARFLPFADLEESVRAGVRAIETCALLPAGFRAWGFVYDVRSGRLHAV
ncbi:MAG TPA: carbonic anhydrase [Gaiellaceae bacterium]|nr:carbonic anhydrase [Gaiellaceae bacterium]